MSAPGIGNLSTLIKRLEAATSRLEDIALHQSSGSSVSSSQRELPSAASAPTAGSVPPPPPPPPAAAEPPKDDPPAVKAYDQEVGEALDEFKQLSAKIGGVVQEQAAAVSKTFQAQRDLILLAASSQKPAGGASSPAFAELLKPLQAALTQVIETRDKNRGDKQHFNHLSTVSEGIPAVGWVAVEPKPGPYVGEMKDSAQFYANRVIKDFKDTDKTHVEWTRSFIKLLEVLKTYVLKTHTTGLAWNPKGGDAASFKVSSTAAPSAVSGGAPPPPPPPPPAADVSAGVAAGGAAAGGMDAVFGQLNQGENITRGLKKVDASQMTHKNPELRGSGAPPPSSKAAPPKLAAKPAQLKAKKPPKTQLDGNKWAVEYHEDNRSIVIDQTELNQTVNIFNCKNSIIQIKGKINAVQMTNCTKCSILVDTLVSSLEVTGSPSFAVQITGRAPTILLDSCDSGQIYLSNKSLDSEIIAAKCSAINVSLPVAGGEEGEYQEYALPEQLKHTVDNLDPKAKSRIKTEVVAHTDARLCEFVLGYSNQRTTGFRVGRHANSISHASLEPSIVHLSSIIPSATQPVHTEAFSSSGIMTARPSGAGLLSLPPEIIDSIASYAAMSDTSFASSSTSAPCSFLYDSSLRESKLVTPPTDLHALQLVCTRLHSLLSLQANPRLYARVFCTKFDTAAIGRRFGKSALTSHNLANELRRRCILLKRMRRCVATAALRPHEGAALLQDDESITEMLWLAYLMMLENDGLNYEQLCWAQLHSFLALHHATEMLDSAVSAGYPSDAVHKALALHLVYLLTDPEQLAFEPRGEAVERLFVLRPFVFAAHKFDAFLAPWTLRNLPITKQTHTPTSGDDGQQSNDDSQPAQGGGPTLATNPFLADLAPRDRSCLVEHVGGKLRIAAPILAQGACFSFFMKVEKDPAVLGMAALSDPDDPTSETTIRQPTATRPPLSLTSSDHDKDVTRLLSCLDPRQSPGLPPLFFKGMFEGIWEGRFSFFDFDSYREMLAGRMRSLYEGPFGEQPQIWKIKEKIVKLGPGELEGGKGSILAAGYTTNEPHSDSPAAAAAAAAAAASSAADAKGKSKALPQDWDRYPTFPDEDGRERYEILLSGTGHSAWGRFVVRGRVRSWDGMLIMTKEYRPDGRGKWLYRGYSVAGGKLVGRWRDTFTPDNMYGYEGCFLFQRRGGA